jgi:hypothetical protein
MKPTERRVRDADDRRPIKTAARFKRRGAQPHIPTHNRTPGQVGQKKTRPRLNFNGRGAGSAKPTPPSQHPPENNGQLPRRPRRSRPRAAVCRSTFGLVANLAWPSYREIVGSMIARRGR